MGANRHIEQDRLELMRMRHREELSALEDEEYRIRRQAAFLETLQDDLEGEIRRRRLWDPFADDGGDDIWRIANGLRFEIEDEIQATAKKLRAVEDELDECLRRQRRELGGFSGPDRAEGGSR